uniref:Uncharacterized protein n=1 Tax=Arion vulgaris TaxID=1028688 RepID=A0A0B7B1V0_9EUPU
MPVMEKYSYIYKQNINCSFPRNEKADELAKNGGNTLNSLTCSITTKDIP